MQRPNKIKILWITVLLAICGYKPILPQGAEKISGPFIISDFPEIFENEDVSESEIRNSRILLKLHSSTTSKNISLANPLPGKYRKFLDNLKGGKASLFYSRTPAVLQQIVTVKKNSKILLKAGSQTGLQLNILPGITYRTGKHLEKGKPLHYTPVNLVLTVNNRDIEVLHGKFITFQTGKQKWLFYLKNAMIAPPANTDNIAHETEAMIADWLLLSTD